MARRDEEKKRRRKKRVEKRQAHERARESRDEFAPPAAPEAVLEEIEATLQALERKMKISSPQHWPGASHRSLERPDRTKFVYASFASESPRGKERLEPFARGIEQGLLNFLPDLDHWALEEFFWHGVPGDDWHPLEAFLAHSAPLYPPEAVRQLRQWKEAHLDFFEIGEVVDDLVTFRRWDALRMAAVGFPLRAITLNMGGVNAQRRDQGKILLTYLAPWDLDQNLYCGMGYGMCYPPAQAVRFLLPYLGLRHPEVVARPLPWNVSAAAFQRHFEVWQRRDWHPWLAERLRFPFQAMIVAAAHRGPIVMEALGLAPTTPEEARSRGIYVLTHSAGESSSVLAGASVVIPFDVTSPERLALAEYQAYRNKVGKPPGIRNTPDRLEF